MDLEKKLEGIKPYQLNCNVFSVYDYPDTYSIQELLNKFFDTINNCVALCNNVLDLAKWLVTIGLEQEVAKKLQQWLEDGTLAKIINEELFADLNKKIDDNYTELDNKIVVNKNSIENIKKLDQYNALDYGFDPTGSTDNSTKLNDLINLVYENGGGIIRIPKGTYKLLNGIIMKPYVTIEGATPWRGKDKEGYTKLNCFSLNEPQFLLREYTGLRNLYFDYPNQSKDSVNTIVNYEWTVKTDTNHLCDDIQLSDLYFPNSYKALCIERAGRFNIKNIYGNPIKEGLYINDSRDLGSIDRVEFWTFTYYVGTPIFEYIKENGVAFNMGQCDGGLYSNMFAFGYNKTFHFTGETWATFVGCTADQSRYPILVDACNMVEFVGGAFIGDRFDCTICKINDVSGSFKIMGSNFFGSNNIGVLNRSQRGSVIVNGYFKDHDNKVKIPVINAGKQMNVITQTENEKIYGWCNINGSYNVVGGGSVVKEFTKDDFKLNDPAVTSIPNGFRVDMGQAVSGEKTIVGFARTDDLSGLVPGLYYLEFTIKQKSKSDRKRFNIDLRNDIGTKIFNKIFDEYPFLEDETTIAVPLYIPDKIYISGLNITFNYYDEPTPTGDYMEIKWIRLVQMGDKALDSTVEHAYKLYSGDGKINYSLKRRLEDRKAISLDDSGFKEVWNTTSDIMQVIVTGGEFSQVKYKRNPSNWLVVGQNSNPTTVLLAPSDGLQVNYTSSNKPSLSYTTFVI